MRQKDCSGVFAGLAALCLASCLAAAAWADDHHARDAARALENRDLTKALSAEMQAALTPRAVLQLLKDGNARFLEDASLERDFLRQVRETTSGQYPMAAILGCIDSRVPHEIVFDKGVGDVFSVRVAGNFVNTDILGSLEFATAVAGSKVVVVLGHSDCGAVKGACDNVELGNLTSTLANIAPAVYSVKDVTGERSSKNRDFVSAVAHRNVDLTVRNVIERSPVMRGLVERGELIVIGAMHDVRSGKVTFHEDSMLSAETIETAR